MKAQFFQKIKIPNLRKVILGWIIATGILSLIIYFLTGIL